MHASSRAWIIINRGTSGSVLFLFFLKQKKDEGGRLNDLMSGLYTILMDIDYLNDTNLNSSLFSFVFFFFLLILLCRLDVDIKTSFPGVRIPHLLFSKSIISSSFLIPW